jgi:putative ABC transport system permease protein
MKFILALSFKNIFRNHRRTILTATGIMIAVAATIFGKSFIDGEFVPIIQNVTDMQTGHIRVTSKEYKDKERLMPVNMTVDYEYIEREIKDISDITLIRPRIKFGTLIAKGDNEVDGMMGFAVLPEREKDFAILKGTTLKKGEIIISKRFAEKQNIKEGDTLVLITQTAYGYINGISLVAKEFYDTGIEYISSYMVFLHIEDAQTILCIGHNKASEVLVYTKDINKSKNVYYEMEKKFKERGYSMIHWESDGSMLQALKVGTSVMFIVALVIFFLASIAIVNTMVMSLYERLKEIGMMKALGLKSGSVYLIFFYEALIIGVFGSFLGLVVGVIAILLGAHYGFDYSAAMKSVELPITPVIYPVMSWTTNIVGFLMGIISSIISSLFVLNRIKKANPAEILRG